MKITYKTERLPQNFIILGYLLILAEVWIGWNPIHACAFNQQKCD